MVEKNSKDNQKKKNTWGGKRKGAGRKKLSQAKSKAKLYVGEDVDLFSLTDAQIINLDTDPSIKTTILKEKWIREKSVITKQQESILMSELEDVYDFIRNEGLEPKFFVYLEERKSHLLQVEIKD